MADGFIVRKGGVTTEQALAPTITEVSTTKTSITFTITNNDASTAVILYELDDTTPDANSIELAAAATSSNIVVTSLAEGTAFDVYATANVTGKVKSNVTELTIETDGFEPSDLSPQLWLDAADSSTITASSGSVSQWNNKGSLSNVTQATSANQPTTGVSTLNSLNVIDFDSDFLTAVTANDYKFLHDGTVNEMFSVVKFGTTANPNDIYALLATGSGTGDVGVRLNYDDRNTENFNDRILHVHFRGVGASFSILGITADDFYAPNTFAILSVLSDPGNGTAANRSEIRKNGGTAVKNNEQTSALSTSNPTRALQIGANSREAATLVGSIAELIIISGSNVTNDNRTTVINYLADKWGITL